MQGMCTQLCRNAPSEQRLREREGYGGTRERHKVQETPEGIPGAWSGKGQHKSQFTLLVLAGFPQQGNPHRLRESAV